jgi:hypothetical protein
MRTETAARGFRPENKSLDAQEVAPVEEKAGEEGLADRTERQVRSLRRSLARLNSAEERTAEEDAC